MTQVARSSTAWIETNNVEITVNPRTIRIGTSVYPIDNLSLFGVGSVSKFPLSWQQTGSLLGGIVVAWLLVFFASILATVAGSELAATIGAMFWLLLIPGLFITIVVVKLSDPQHRGLLLAPNSGDRRLFVTTDLNGVARITRMVGEILDGGMQERDSYVITITNSDVSGNLLIGSSAEAVSSAPRPPDPVPPTPAPVDQSTESGAPS